LTEIDIMLFWVPR